MLSIHTGERHCLPLLYSAQSPLRLTLIEVVPGDLYLHLRRCPAPHSPPGQFCCLGSTCQLSIVALSHTGHIVHRCEDGGVAGDIVLLYLVVQCAGETILLDTVYGHLCPLVTLTTPLTGGSGQVDSLEESRTSANTVVLPGAGPLARAHVVARTFATWLALAHVIGNVIVHVVAVLTVVITSLPGAVALCVVTITV